MPGQLRLPRPLLRKFTFAKLLLCAFFLSFLYDALCVSFEQYTVQKGRRKSLPFADQAKSKDLLTSLSFRCAGVSFGSLILTPLLVTRLLCRLGTGASMSPSIGLDFRFRGCTGFALPFPSPTALPPALIGLKSSVFGTSAMPSCSNKARFAAMFFSRSSSLVNASEIVRKSGNALHTIRLAL